MSSDLVSRRAVTRGVAWTVPLVAVGVAAPAFAASSAFPSPAATSLCSCAANKRYRLNLNFSNDGTDSFTLSAMSVDIGNETGLPVTPITATVVAGPGTTSLGFVFNRGNNGPFTSVTLTYTATNNISGAISPSQTVTLSVSTATSCTSPTC
jgi:hypothetical protein